MDAPGVGLAAPQLGVGLRVFTYYVDGELGHLVNPDLDLSDEMQEEEEDACLCPTSGSPPRARSGWSPKGFTMYGDPITVEGTRWPAASSMRQTTSTGAVHRPARSGLRKQAVRRDPRVRLVRPRHHRQDQPHVPRTRDGLVFAGTPQVSVVNLSPAGLAARSTGCGHRVRTPWRPRPSRHASHVSVAARACGSGVDPQRPSDPDFVAALRDLAPDCCPVVVHGALIPQHVLDIAQGLGEPAFLAVAPAWRGGTGPARHHGRRRCHGRGGVRVGGWDGHPARSTASSPKTIGPAARRRRPTGGAAHPVPNSW